MSTRLGRAAMLTTTLLVVAPGAQTSSAQPIDPTVSVDRTGTAAGEKMLITGGGWPGGATLVVELCGHGGLSGSVDCDVPNQRTAGVGTSGTFSVELTVALPPSPCPCVVKATDQSSKIAAAAPIAVAGIPTVPITGADGPAPGGIEVASMKISGGGHWAELFGAGGRRVLEVRLVNTGATTVQSPDVSVAWGRGKRPDGFVPPPETAPMEPGETQTLTVPLDRPALTIGKQTAIVEIQSVRGPVSAAAQTSGYPWGLIASGLVALQLVLLRVRNRVRRRLAAHPGTVDDRPRSEKGVLALAVGVPALAASSPPEPPTVIELDHLERQALPEPPSRGGDGLSERSPLVSTAAAATSNNGQRPNPAPLEPGLAPHAQHVESTRNQLREVQIEARVVLERAMSLSDALVVAATRRIEVLEADAEEHRRQAHDSYQTALKLVAEARARADEVMAAAAAAAGALLDAERERDAVHGALADIESQRRGLAAHAATAIDEVLAEIEGRLRALPPASPNGETASALAADSTDGRPLDDLDRRIADAVSRALARASSSRGSPD